MIISGRRIVVEGVVQGVGFRPYAYTLAERHGLSGWVRNTARGVEIEVEGTPGALSAFLASLVLEAPPLACIDRVRVEEVSPRGYQSFEIEVSRDGGGFQPVSPDVASCPECLAELTDPRDRRFGYPFTNCTRCGPRFTIIRAIPYDRPNTTMAGFAMCADCRAEYDDPRDRRFHAQPDACPTCGPRLTLVDAGGRETAGDPLVETARLLASGRIVAIKGIGGFHLACDATNDAAVRRLRRRKGREAKPLALMVPDLAEAERLCVLSDAERALLRSPAGPIVLLRERVDSGIGASVAPGLGWLGLMLPYSPLHHLLFRPPHPPLSSIGGEGELNTPCPSGGEGGATALSRAGGEGRLRALVMTSGNRSEEPIATDNADALARLGSIADAFLLHDRPIHVRCDDSVTRVAAGGELPVRRSRGYAPLPVRLPFESPPILALGAELKSALCLARGPYAFMSPHIGDLENYDTYVSYERMAEHMQALFRVRPEAVAHDLHPDYLSTRYALSLDPRIPRVPVQHHHAHVAACMAEHRLGGPVIGVAFDGTGYGPDGTIWGGEFLVVDYAGFRRAAHLGEVPLPGGDRAVREPFRVALAHLLRACGEWDASLPPVREATEAERRAIRWQIERGVNAPLTSSVGRLFDAVASILGVRHRARYEAQAAMELETLVDPGAEGAYRVTIIDGDPLVIAPGPLIRGVVADLKGGAPIPVIAARFHATLAAAIVSTCERIREATGLGRVALSGGVFQNVTLLARAVEMLGRAGFEVFTHHAVPPNDGGIALGQAAVAQARLATDTLTPALSLEGRGETH
jgi:hydrogenase maturation protein HypF